MVAHQAVGKAEPAEAVKHTREDIQEREPVGVVAEDRAPLVAARRDVVDAARELKPQRTCHGTKLARLASANLTVVAWKCGEFRTRAGMQDLTPSSRPALEESERRKAHSRGAKR